MLSKEGDDLYPQSYKNQVNEQPVKNFESPIDAASDLYPTVIRKIENEGSDEQVNRLHDIEHTEYPTEACCSTCGKARESEKKVEFASSDDDLYPYKLKNSSNGTLKPSNVRSEKETNKHVDCYPNVYKTLENSDNSEELYRVQRNRRTSCCSSCGR